MLTRLIGWTLSLLMFTGCASFGASPTNMTPEQLKEWVKDKNANIVCIVANTPYGKGSALYLNLDKGIVVNGTLTVDDACKTTITNTLTPTR